MPALPANPHSLLESRRPGVSRVLEQARPDLLPGDDIGGVLLVPSDAVVKLRSLPSVSDTASASRLSQTVSSRSAFYAGERLFIWFRKSLICL
jgi:hypothetical protein